MSVQQGGRARPAVNGIALTTAPAPVGSVIGHLTSDLGEGRGCFGRPMVAVKHEGGGGKMRGHKDRARGYRSVLYSRVQCTGWSTVQFSRAQYNSLQFMSEHPKPCCEGIVALCSGASRKDWKLSSANTGRE